MDLPPEATAESIMPEPGQIVSSLLATIESGTLTVTVTVCVLDEGHPIMSVAFTV